MRSLTALSHISFQSCVRQPFFSLIIVVAYLFILSSPAFTMFTMLNAARLIQDMSMGTILMVVMAVSVLGTSSIVAGEVEEKTAALMLSKPISRITFLTGKFFGVALSLLLVVIPLGAVLIMTLFMGVPEAAYSEVNYPTLWFELLPLAGALVVAAGASYYADRHFASTFIYSLNIMVLISLIILHLLNRGALKMDLLQPVLFMWMAGVLIAPISALFSLQGSVLFTLLLSFFVFITGLTASYFLGDMTDKPLIRIIYPLIPNFQVYWVEEVWTKGEKLTGAYIWDAVKYTVIYCTAMLFLGWSFWENRELT